MPLSWNKVVFVSALLLGYATAQQGAYYGTSGYVEYVNASAQLVGAGAALNLRFQACQDSGAILAVADDQGLSFVLSVVGREVFVSFREGSGFINATSVGATLVPGMWYDLTLRNIAAGSEGGFAMEINGYAQVVQFSGRLPGYGIESLQGSLYIGGHPQAGFLDLCLYHLHTAQRDISVLSGDHVHGPVTGSCPDAHCIVTSITMLENDSFMELGMALHTEGYAELFIRFQTSASDGLLVYLGEGTFSYIVVALTNGFVRAYTNASYGDDSNVATTERAYNDSLIHSVHLVYHAPALLLQVDNENITMETAGNRIVISSLWLGIPPFQDLPYYTNNQLSLRGCLYNFAYSTNYTSKLNFVDPTKQRSKSIIADACVPHLTCPQPCNGTAFEECHFSCQCQSGYERGDMGLCVEKNECQPNPCLNGGTCHDLFQNYTCQCGDDFKGRNCEAVRSCSSSPCVNGGTCNEQDFAYICSCANGFMGQSCEVAYDPCPSDHCGNFSTCDTGPCANGATCEDINGGVYTCSCLPGWTGKVCDEDIDECSIFAACQNGGQCSNTLGSYECFCPNGWTGDQCTMQVNFCGKEPCQNGGSCANLENEAGYMCSCLPGHTGLRCEVDVDECATNPCLNNGTCIDRTSGYVCVCAEGLTGARCEMMLGNCSSSLCQNGATCQQLVGGLECKCASGFEGIFCERDINECDSNPCLNGGRCIDLVARYKCNCSQGFSGTHCQNRITSPSPSVSSREIAASSTEVAVEPSKTPSVSSREMVASSTEVTIKPSKTPSVSSREIAASSTEAAVKPSEVLSLSLIAPSTKAAIPFETLSATSIEKMLSSTEVAIKPSATSIEKMLSSTEVAIQPSETTSVHSSETISSSTKVVLQPFETPSMGLTKMVASSTEVSVQPRLSEILASSTELAVEPTKTPSVSSMEIMFSSTEVTVKSSETPSMNLTGISRPLEIVSLSKEMPVQQTLSFTEKSSIGLMEAVYSSIKVVAQPSETHSVSLTQTHSVSLVPSSTEVGARPHQTLSDGSRNLLLSSTENKLLQSQTVVPSDVTQPFVTPLKTTMVLSPSAMVQTSSTYDVTPVSSDRYVTPVSSDHYGSSRAITYTSLHLFSSILRRPDNTTLSVSTAAETTLKRPMFTPSSSTNDITERSTMAALTTAMSPAISKVFMTTVMSTSFPTDTLISSRSGQTTSSMVIKVSSSLLGEGSLSVKTAYTTVTNMLTMVKSNPGHTSSFITAAKASPSSDGGVMLPKKTEVAPVTAGVTTAAAVLALVIVAMVLVGIVLYYRRYKRRHDYYSPREAEWGNVNLEADEEKVKERLI